MHDMVRTQQFWLPIVCGRVHLVYSMHCKRAGIQRKYCGCQHKGLKFTRCLRELHWIKILEKSSSWTLAFHLLQHVSDPSILHQESDAEQHYAVACGTIRSQRYQAKKRPFETGGHPNLAPSRCFWQNTYHKTQRAGSRVHLVQGDYFSSAQYWSEGKGKIAFKGKIAQERAIWVLLGRTRCAKLEIIHYLKVSTVVLRARVGIDEFNNSRVWTSSIDLQWRRLHHASGLGAWRRTESYHYVRGRRCPDRFLGLLRHV